ncbi:MAG TPA: D-alanyl-D-alanine carboxypeptidase/D-alanyl-D-alanine-endopeptidase [Verrucomicrobiae bacterium]
MIQRYLAVLCLGLLFATESILPAAQALPEGVKAVLDRPEYRHAHWGILFADVATGETVYEVNAEKLFGPASVTKVFSTASAWEYLGEGHQFKTHVRRRGEVEGDGVLKGDLILVASGDPTMGGRTDEQGRIAFKDVDHIYSNWTPANELTPQDPLAGLKELARQIAKAGIKRVSGDVVVDDRLFDKAEGSGSGPSLLTPIVVNDNVVDFIIAPGKEGEKAKVTWRPHSMGIQVDAQVETIAEGKPVITVRSEGGGYYSLRGQIPATNAPLVRIADVADPAAYARMLFVEALQAAGVMVMASPLATNNLSALPPSEAVAKLAPVATLVSPPFRENAKLILKVSHNQHAGMLPLLVAVQQGQRTVNEGLQWQRKFLLKAGVEADAISFGGAAGGSRADLVTPKATVQLLRYMSTRKDFAEFEAALPVLGKDGTLAAISKNHAAAGKVMAKTGTYVVDNSLNGTGLLTSKALAGYMTTQKGRKLAFAVFVNMTHLREGEKSSREGEALGRICEVVFEMN